MGTIQWLQKICMLQLILTNICHAQTDWSINEKFRGQVRSIRTTKYSPQLNHTRDSVWVSDSLTSKNIIGIRVFEFEKGNKLSKHLWIKNQTDTVGYCLWSYNSNGKVIKQVDYLEGNRLEGLIAYSYPSDSLAIIEYFDKDGIIYSTWDRWIDSSKYEIGNLETVKGTKDSHYITVLNNSFLPWKYYEIDSTGNRVQLSELLYDKKNNIVSSKHWKSNDKGYSHLKFRYDNQGNCIEMKLIDKNGKIIRRTVNKYDGLRNVIKTVTKLQDGTNYIETIDYQYDEQGNWTLKKQVSELDGKVFEYLRTLRTIDYY